MTMLQLFVLAELLLNAMGEIGIGIKGIIVHFVKKAFQL
jgi:hypothetical protein